MGPTPCSSSSDVPDAVTASRTRRLAVAMSPTTEAAAIPAIRAKPYPSGSVFTQASGRGDGSVRPPRSWTHPVVSSAMVLARLSLVPVVVALAITTVSCSSDDPSGDLSADTSAVEDQESVDVLTSFFRQSGEADPNAVQYDDDAARCMAEGLLEVLGEARLADLGLDTATGNGPTLATPPLDEAESALVHELMLECVDLIEQTAALFEDAGMSRADAACTASEYANSGLLAESLASEQFDPELNTRIDEAIRAAMADCGVEETP
jgi:hypothetical protein